MGSANYVKSEDRLEGPAGVQADFDLSFQAGPTRLMAGARPRAEAHYAYFGEGDVYLNSSSLEGPLTLLEAMGAGLWPVCIDTGLAPKLVRHSENGYLIAADADEMTWLDNAAVCLDRLDPQDLVAYRPLVRNSMADRTSSRFREDATRVIAELFDGRGRQ